MGRVALSATGQKPVQLLVAALVFVLFPHIATGDCDYCQNGGTCTLTARGEHLKAKGTGAKPYDREPCDNEHKTGPFYNCACAPNYRGDDCQIYCKTKILPPEAMDIFQEIKIIANESCPLNISFTCPDWSGNVSGHLHGDTLQLVSAQVYEGEFDMYGCFQAGKNTRYRVLVQSAPKINRDEGVCQYETDSKQLHCPVIPGMPESTSSWLAVAGNDSRNCYGFGTLEGSSCKNAKHFPYHLDKQLKCINPSDSNNLDITLQGQPTDCFGCYRCTVQNNLGSTSFDIFHCPDLTCTSKGSWPFDSQTTVIPYEWLNNVGESAPQPKRASVGESALFNFSIQLNPKNVRTIHWYFNGTPIADFPALTSHFTVDWYFCGVGSELKINVSKELEGNYTASVMTYDHREIEIHPPFMLLVYEKQGSSSSSDLYLIIGLASGGGGAFVLLMVIVKVCLRFKNKKHKKSYSTAVQESVRKNELTPKFNRKASDSGSGNNNMNGQAFVRLSTSSFSERNRGFVEMAHQELDAIPQDKVPTSENDEKQAKSEDGNVGHEQSKSGKSSEDHNASVTESSVWSKVGKLAKYVVEDWKSLGDELQVPAWKQHEFSINNPRDVVGTVREVLYFWYVKVPEESAINDLKAALGRCQLKEACGLWLDEINGCVDAETHQGL